MSLFPQCSFQVEVAGGRILPGQRLDGTLVLTARNPIPRAQHLDLLFHTQAWAGYGAGKSRTVVRRNMFQAPLHVTLPKDVPLAAGTHRYPFALDLPPWLPPGYVGQDCAIEHSLRTHLDVDWAVDPKATLTPTITVRPREGRRAGIIVRSPPRFHDAVVVEVTLESTVIRADEPIRGQVALRAGHAANFKNIELTIASTATILMSRGDKRHLERSRLLIPAASLRGGAAVAFTFPPVANLPPTFRTSFINHDVALLVALDLPWARDPRFSVALDVLPVGSTVHGEAVTNIVGSERLRHLGAAMARATGLQEAARANELVHGKIGCVSLSMSDAPSGEHLGIDLDFTYPDVELGLVFRLPGLLDAFSDSPLLPPAMNHYFLRTEPEDARPRPDLEAVRTFVATALVPLARATSLRLSDHHLAGHVAIDADDETHLVDLAKTALSVATQLDEAIRALPFPPALAAGRAAWQATANEQNAFLVPTGPTIHGVLLEARVADGEARVARAMLRTIWKTEKPTFQIDLDLEATPLPEAARLQVEDLQLEALRAVRTQLEILHVAEDGRSAMLAHDGWPADPRAMLPALEAFFAWVLEARGERRVNLPYR